MLQIVSVTEEPVIVPLVECVPVPVCVLLVMLCGSQHPCVTLLGGYTGRLAAIVNAVGPTYHTLRELLARPGVYGHGRYMSMALAASHAQESRRASCHTKHESYVNV